MRNSVAGKVTIITGGGSGIGRAMVRNFAEAGAALAILDIRQDRAGEAAEEARALGVQAIGIVADGARAADVEAAVKQVVQEFGRIDVLCNNAGITDRQRPLLETPPEIWERVVAVNLTGPYLMCRAAMPVMLAQGRGVIINTASIAGFLGGRSGAAYTASKHGVIGLTRSIAAAYGSQGIRCNAISPGSVATDISSGEFGGEASPAAIVLRDKGLATRPSRATPDQISPVALFLASDASAYINGQNITADDGWTAY